MIQPTPAGPHPLSRPRVSLLVVMMDGDNTGAKGVAYVDRIQFCSESPSGATMNRLAPSDDAAGGRPTAGSASGAAAKAPRGAGRL